MTILHRLAVTYRATGSLNPDPRNARTHSKRQLEQIAVSIRQFGFTNPVLIDPEGVLIAGHGRLLAAKSIGMAEVPTIASFPAIRSGGTLPCRMSLADT